MNLKDMVKQIMLEDVFDKEIKNPKTGNKIKVRTALQLPDEHPANKKAKEMVAKTGDVGGPAYPNVPKKKKGKSVFDKDKPAFKKPSDMGSGQGMMKTGYDEPTAADDVESNWDKASKEFESLEDKHGVRIDDQSDWSGIENNPRGEYSVSGKNSEDPGDGFSIYSTVETGEDGESYKGNKNIITFPQDDDPFGGQVELEFDSIGDAKEALDKILSDKKIKSALDGGRADMANNKDYIKKQVEKLGGKTIGEPKEKPKRPKSMRSLDWDSELEPYEIEGWVQDNKSSIPNRLQFSLNDLVDKYGDAYAEAEATGDYDKPNEIQKQIDQLLTKSMTRESIRETKKMAKLKDLLSEAFEDIPQIDKHKVIEGVRNFGIVGKSLYNNNNIMETAKQLADIAESAHNHILGEQDDWFDKISVNKNMKSLKGSVVEFQKAAKEAHQLNQRMTALYEDIGHVLNRYYDIDEAHVYGHDDEDSEMEEKLDKVDPSKVEPGDDFKDREDKDIDNDGDVDDSDEYLHKKRQAITKAIKKESSLGGVVGIPALGDMIRKK